MIGKRFSKVRYASGGEGGLTEKTRACGDECDENWTDNKRKWATKAEMYEKLQEKLKFSASIHVGSLKFESHLSGSCQNSHKA